MSSIQEDKEEIKENKIEIKEEETENEIKEEKEEKGEKEEKDEKIEEQIIEDFDEDKERISALSFSSYDSIDNVKLNKMGQYTCDKCSEIPKIVSTDLKNKKIIIKCKEHGQNEINIQDFLVNTLNYNTNNWKCSQCPNIQRDQKENFLFCECGEVFCVSCYKRHQEKLKHYNSIQSDNYNLRCRVKPDHYNEKNIGYCYDCNTHYCKKCEKEDKHDLHTVVPIDKLIVDEKEIENIRKLNKEYRSLISYYESLIRLNNLVIHSYKKYRNNYYNCFNLNTIINNYKRNNYITSVNDIENKVIVPGEKNENLIKYMNQLYQQEIDLEKTESIELDNKYFDNFDFKVLTQIPIKNIHVLVLENNCISNIDTIAKAEFPELVVLNLNNNAIVNIKPLEQAKFAENVQAILLRNNYITDISPIGNFKYDYLRELDLRNNNIDNIEVFADIKLEFLQCLYLSYNKFDPKNKKFEKAIEKMKKELVEYELEPEKEEMGEKAAPTKEETS